MPRLFGTNFSICKSISSTDSCLLDFFSLTKLLGFGISFCLAISEKFVLAILFNNSPEDSININSFSSKSSSKPSSVSIVIVFPFTFKTFPFIASSSTEILSPFVNIILLFLDFYLVFWRLILTFQKRK